MPDFSDKITPNDAYRLEQKIGMALFLDKTQQRYAEYNDRIKKDPMNKEFAELPVLYVNLCQQKHNLFPLLDERVFDMLLDMEFFP